MARRWKVGVVYDTARKTKGHHGTHFCFTGLPGVEQVLADPNGDDLEPRLDAIGAVRHYAEYREMIEREKLDIVTVCSRLPGDHPDVIRVAAECGCHVLCEKPFAASLEDADEMIALAERNGIKIAVAHLARYALVFRTVKSMIERGKIGRPLTFYGRGKEDERGGGEDMIVLGTHILDLAVFLFGPPEHVRADVRTDGRPIVRDDRCMTTEPVGTCAGDSVWAHFAFAGGVNGVFESRRGLCTGPVRMGITVAGTEGTISVRYDGTRALRVCRSALPPEDEARYDVVELREDRAVPRGATPFDHERYEAQPAHYFAEGNRFAALDLMGAIEEDRQPVSSAYDATTALEMIYGVYASSLERRAIAFPLEDRRHPLET